jgi:thioredoxin 1
MLNPYDKEVECMIKDIAESDYDGVDKGGFVLLEFYSTTCGPCKMLSYVLKEIDKENPELKIYTIDFNASAALREKCGVKGFPTMLFLKDGKEVSRMEGLKQKPAIVSEINKWK